MYTTKSTGKVAALAHQVISKCGILTATGRFTISTRVMGPNKMNVESGPPVPQRRLASSIVAALTLAVVVTMGVGLVTGVYLSGPTSMSVGIWTAVVCLPAGICGAIAFFTAIRRLYYGETAADLWRAVKDFWNAFVKYGP